MNEKLKSILKLLALPVSLLVIYLSLQAIRQVFNLPDNEHLIEIIKIYFKEYGLIIVFIGALIEGTLLLGQYFPGGFIIFLGVIAAGNNIPQATGVVSVVSLSFMIAYSINYIMGRYGWYLLFKKFGLLNAIENAKAKLVRHELMAVLSTYWEPNLASITATAAGVLKISFKKFFLYSIIGILIWNTFWGTFVFFLGEKALQLAGFKYVIIIFAVWVTIILINHYVIQRTKINLDNTDISKGA